MDLPFRKERHEVAASHSYGRRIRKGRYAFLVFVYLLALFGVARVPLWLLGNEGAWQALVALAITAAFLYPVWRWASRCEYFYRYD